MSVLEIVCKSTLLHHLRNGEHFDLFRAIVKHIQAIGIKPAGLMNAWNHFLQAFTKEDIIYKRAAKRAGTALVKAAHEKRKKSYMALKLMIEATSYDGTPAAKEAAGALLEMMENYAAANYAPMTEASALFVNLIQDLGKDIYADKVALIMGAETAINNLNLHNEDFMTLYEERALAGEEGKIEGTMRDARKLVDQKFAVLVDSINSFYFVAETQTPKDQEVSEALSSIIVFVNSYLSQYETILARRGAGTHAGSNKPSLPDEGDDPFFPGDGIPQLAIAAQETLGESQAMPGFGVQMSLRAADATAFAAALYPDARNGLLRLTWPETENGESFPIADFLFDTDGTTPVGLLVDAPDIYTFFIKPFTGTDPAGAAVYKGDELLATLTGVQFPATISEG
jgi:hypothetical protein